MSKIIKRPKGLALEYAPYSALLTEGCTTPKCTYCYMCNMSKRFGLYFGEARLRSCFASEDKAKEIFMKEIQKNTLTLQKTGLFFSFTSDFLPKTQNILIWAIEFCIEMGVPVKILTKQTDWIDDDLLRFFRKRIIECNSTFENMIAFGFTLTGHDEMEQGCATNQQRINAMKMVKKYGFLTFASIEPIIDFKSSFEMIEKTLEFCDLYKIGLKSGAKYDKIDLLQFMFCIKVIMTGKQKIYFKDSLLKLAGFTREQLPYNCVNRDYNLFKNI